MISSKSFGEYKLYTIRNKNGMSVSVCDLGATVQSLTVPDRNGVFCDVVLGYDTPEEYLENGDYLGAFVGRYANRIEGAAFTLNGREYHLTANEGKNTLHGGRGLSKRRFEAHCGENDVRFEIFSPDGDDGFPGNVSISVTYTLTDDDALCIDYEAATDADTVINLTNHAYFNLKGSGDVMSHELMINARHYLPVDHELIPTGEKRDVSGTDFDFRRLRPIKYGYYDHCFCLDGEPCAVLYEPESGRRMTVGTDLPAVQLYCAGGLGCRRGKGGAVYGKNSGLCLETQFFPDSPNRPDFPSCLLKKGETFKSCTVYKFDTV